MNEALFTAILQIVFEQATNPLVAQEIEQLAARGELGRGHIQHLLFGGLSGPVADKG